MNSGIADTIVHPFDALVSDVGAAVQAYGSAPAWTVAASRIPVLLEELVAAQNALDSVRLRLLREADRHRLGEAAGHTSTANWWAVRAQVTRPAAHRELRLAESLDDSVHEAAAEALASGAVSTEQASVITHAVDQLPLDLVGPVLRRRAETDLVALAEHHDPQGTTPAGPADPGGPGTADRRGDRTPASGTRGTTRTPDRAVHHES